MPDLMQSVTLLTDDGRRLTFTGRATIDPDDPPRVVGIEAGVPRPLPAGVTWEDCNYED